jgi:hypothetical protein
MSTTVRVSEETRRRVAALGQGDGTTGPASHRGRGPASSARSAVTDDRAEDEDGARVGRLRLRSRIDRVVFSWPRPERRRSSPTSHCLPSRHPGRLPRNAESRSFSPRRAFRRRSRGGAPRNMMAPAPNESSPSRLSWAATTFVATRTSPPWFVPNALKRWSNGTKSRILKVTNVRPAVVAAAKISSSARPIRAVLSTPATTSWPCAHNWAAIVL